jgi:hypothetical protein
MESRKGLGWLFVLLVAVCVPVMASTPMVSVSVNEDALYTTVQKVRLDLVYTGNQVPTEMRVYPNADGDWSEWFDYSNGLDWVLPGDDGLRTVKVETRYWIESRTDETVYSGWRVVAGEDDIFVDLTPPVLTVSVRDANENGWYNRPVPIVFRASDAASGLAASPDTVILDQEGAGQSVVGRAVDKAGNETEVAVRNINIDLTPPILEVSVPAANENGWYNAPVSIAFAARDSLSGIASAPEDRTISTSRIIEIVSQATDKAGNRTTLSRVLQIDVDAPSIVVAGVEPGASPDVWIPGPVKATFLGSDELSGVASIEVVDGAEVLTADGGSQTVTAQVSDLAGNTSEIGVDSINIDSTLPTTTVVLVAGEGTSIANTLGPVLTPIDLTAKLDAFGTYDPANVALGFSFVDAAGAPVAGLTAYATVLDIGVDGAITEIHFFRFCEFAPTGGFYYFVLPAKLVSGDVYEVWFEESGGAHLFKTRVIAP